MTDVKETDPGVTPPAETEKGPPQAYDGPAVDYHGDPPRPRGWMYKAFRVGPVFIPWYASPRIQLGMVSFVCFMCPGMYNALQGLGGAGKADAELVSKMNTALYSVFAVVGFMAGTIVNWIGIRISIAIGGVGYCLYSISLLVSTMQYVPGFNIFAGAFLGLCAGILWAAQGCIMLSYPPEDKKGRYFAWFWGIFNIGGCMGSLIALGMNIETEESSKVQSGTYIAFIVLMGFGAILAIMLVDGNKVIRSDGSKVILKQNPSLMTELYGLWETIRFDPWLIFLFPMFWSSNWFYTYQMSVVNGAVFNIRTRALNSFLYWLAQILAAIIMGPLLDLKYFRRSVRAKASLVLLLAVTMAIYGGGYAWQKRYTRHSVSEDAGYVPWDWTHSEFLGPMFLYLFYGAYDALYQGCAYWYMGALSNSGRRTANLVGFYKGLQSAGAAVAWSLEFNKSPFMEQFASNWGILCASIVAAAPVIFLRIKDHIDISDDLRNTGEEAEDVLPEGHEQKRPSTH